MSIQDEARVEADECQRVFGGLEPNAASLLRKLAAEVDRLVADLAREREKVERFDGVRRAYEEAAYRTVLAARSERDAERDTLQRLRESVRAIALQIDADGCGGCVGEFMEELFLAAEPSELERSGEYLTLLREERERAERAERERDALVSALGRSYQTLKALGRNRQAVIRDLDETYAEIDAALGRVEAGEGKR